MIINKETRDTLLDIAKNKMIFLEGNLLKIIKADDGDTEFQKYLDDCINKDKEFRKKRLQITKDIQKKNRELESAFEELRQSKDEADRLRIEAETAKEIVEQDLSNLQKKTQTELMSNIVNVALWVIMGVGVITTLMYVVAIIMNTETQVIGSTWSNLTGILLTNAFSIVGTIMGVKHATSTDKK
jgi:Fe2+ transport system protein B